MINARIFEAVLNEVASAKSKFPGNIHMLHALTEECGEVTQAMLNQYHAWTGAGYIDLIHAEHNSRVRKELIQTMAMCLRLLTEGDAGLPYEPMK